MFNYVKVKYEYFLFFFNHSSNCERIKNCEEETGKGLRPRERRWFIELIEIRVCASNAIQRQPDAKRPGASPIKMPFVDSHGRRSRVRFNFTISHRAEDHPPWSRSVDHKRFHRAPIDLGRGVLYGWKKWRLGTMDRLLWRNKCAWEEGTGLLLSAILL